MPVGGFGHGLRLSRRRLLAASLAWIVTPAAAWPQTPGGPDTATLSAFVDTLLPEDAVSPAASTLGVPDAILDFSADVSGLGDLISGGTAWLNKTGGPPFAQLPEQDRTRLITWMAESDPAGGPNRFYEVVRLLAVEFYFARPEAISGFPLNTAPQPRGYPPPWS
jgi:hypothetical protein